MGMDLAADVYRISEAFPSSEKFGLTAQVRRCAVSIPSNLAEGYGRGTDADFARFAKIARGSLYELRTQYELAVRLDFILPDDETLRTMVALSKKLDAFAKHREGRSANR